MSSAVLAADERIARIRVPTAPETAAQAIRDAILEGRLKPSERILEQHWAAALGIGQPTLREALKELEYQGLVRRTSHRGTFVTQLNKDDYARLLAVRIPLEAMAFVRAARRIDGQATRELTGLVERMGRGARSGSVALFHEADVEFHRRIWELADNDYLRMCLGSVTIRLLVFPTLDGRPRIDEERSAAVEQHRGFLEALVSGDPAQACRKYIALTLAYWNRYQGLNRLRPSGGLHAAFESAVL